VCSDLIVRGDVLKNSGRFDAGRVIAFTVPLHRSHPRLVESDPAFYLEIILSHFLTIKIKFDPFLHH
jgi:hypothetical protein